MKQIIFCSLLVGAALTACAPTEQTASMAQVTPVLIKASESAARGGTLTIQGRYLGSPINGKVRLGATTEGEGGWVFPASAIQSWTDREIVLTIPEDAPTTASWLFVEVDGLQSSGLPYSIRQ